MTVYLFKDLLHIAAVVCLVLLASYTFSSADVVLGKSAVYGLRQLQAGSLLDPVCIFVVRHRRWMLLCTLAPLELTFVFHECNSEFSRIRAFSQYVFSLCRRAVGTAPESADRRVEKPASGEDPANQPVQPAETQSFWQRRYQALLWHLPDSRRIEELEREVVALQAELDGYKRQVEPPPLTVVRPTNPAFKEALHQYNSRGIILRVARYKNPTIQELERYSETACTKTVDSGGPAVTLTRRGQDTRIGFGEVFDPSDTNQVVFESLKTLAAGMEKGHNICIWGDGPSAAGKSFTFTKRTDSIIPQFGSFLLEAACETSHIICMRAFELYNDEVIDVVARAAGTIALDFEIVQPGIDRTPRKRDNKTKAKQWRDANMVVLPDRTTPEQISGVCAKIESARTNRETAMNSTSPEAKTAANKAGSSSRGHLIVVFTAADSRDHRQERDGRFVLADFAGSEHPAENASPERRAEYDFIKSSKSDFYNALVQSLTQNLPVPTFSLGLMLFELFGYESSKLRLAQVMHFHPADSQLNSYLVTDCQALEKAPTRKFQLRPAPALVRGLPTTLSKPRSQT